HPGQPYADQAYPGQPYADQAYPGQPYPGQPYPGQPYPGQPYPGQPYPGYAPHPGSQSSVFSILTFIFGGIAVLLSPFIFGVIALILGGIAKRRGERLARVALRVASICMIGGFILNFLARVSYYNF
ncbi:hypothetical protein, partial [Actinoplanes palleronii]